MSSMTSCHVKSRDINAQHAPLGSFLSLDDGQVRLGLEVNPRLGLGESEHRAKRGVSERESKGSSEDTWLVETSALSSNDSSALLSACIYTHGVPSM